jgi:hypothetical protein
MTLTTSEGSRAQVEQVLTLFMSDNNFQVLALKGKWGVGKTHLIKDFLDRRKQDFYYASVFGLSSIDQLKSRILAGHKPKIDNPTISENLQTDVKIVGKRLLGNIWGFFSKNSSRIEKNSGIGDFKIAGSLITMTGDLAFNLIFNNIKDSLMCIDDLERKSNLSLDEILGFTEYLVQDLKCKVIIIYNEEELVKDEAAKEVLSKYREKVIDIEVELNPTVEENFSFVFKEDETHLNIIQETFEKTKINNIRVLKKTKWNLDKFQPLIKDWNPIIISLIIRNIIIISLVKLDTTFGVTMNSLLDYKGYEDEERNRYYQEKKQLELTEQEKKTIKEKSILSDIKYHTYSFQVINSHILKFVETFLLDEVLFIDIGEKLSEGENKSKIIKEFDEIGLPLLGSFKDSTQEITNNIVNFLDKHSIDLDISDFEYLERWLINIYLPELDVSQYKAKLFKNLIEKSNPTNFQEVKRLESLRKKVENFPELQELLEYKISEYNNTLDIPKEITRILTKRIKETCSTQEVLQDIDFLNDLTKDDFIKWLKIDNPLLSMMIKECLNIHGTAVRLAIEEMARDNPFMIRIARHLYDINVENTTEN